MQWPLRSKGLVTWFILHLVNLASEALPKLGSEPPFSEDSLLSYEFKSNDVAVAVAVRGRLRKSIHSVLERP